MNLYERHADLKARCLPLTNFWKNLALELRENKYYFSFNIRITLSIIFH